MSDIVNIARSGVLAYRDALSVTAQNIANVNTEGYHRRDVSMKEVGGAQATPFTKGSTGQGVRIDQVVRAYDAFLAQRTNAATADRSAADSYLSGVQMLETSLVPGDTDLASMMDDFFAKLGSLSQAPGDLAQRNVVLEGGRAFAGAISSLAESLTGLRQSIADQATTVATEANANLSELARLSSTLGQSNGVDTASDILDHRDRLIASTAELVGVTARPTAAANTLVLTLGSSGDGPSLIDAGRAAQIEVVEASDRLVAFLRNGPARSEVGRLEGGALEGLFSAWGAVDTAISDLNKLAKQVSSDMNNLHRQGLDMDGNSGGDLFAVDSFDVTPALGNGGRVQVETSITGPVLHQEITLARDSQNLLWRAYDAGGNELASGQDVLNLPGVSFHITGRPSAGDILSLSYDPGSAANMRFLLNRPEAIAAAAMSSVSPDGANGGSATATVDFSGQLETSGLSSLADLLGNETSALAAVDFRKPGVVGIIPANATAVELASLTRQSSLAFSLSSTEMSSAQTMSFTLAGAPHSIDLTGGATAQDWSDMGDLAERLNAGAIKTVGGESLFDLGLNVTGAGGHLTLSAASGDFATGAAIQSGAQTIAGLSTTSEALASTIQIFSREGRHIAGSPMSAEDAATLMTAANGFSGQAVYNADYLNSADGVGYRGITLEKFSNDGDHALSLTPGGIPGAAIVWDGTVPALATPATTLDIDLGEAGSFSFDIPEGASAKRASAIINEATSQLALSTNAATRIEMAAPEDGLLSFTLEAENLTPISVSGQVVGGRLDQIANGINALTRQTGISAVLSPESSRMILSNADGETVTLGDVRHSANASVALSEVDAAGLAIDGTAVMLDGAIGSSARFTGRLDLSAATAFSTSVGGDTADSLAQEFSGSHIQSNSSASGTLQTLTFNASALIDGASADNRGLSSVAASSVYSVSLPTAAGAPALDVTLNSRDLAELDGSSVAQALASKLRAQAPIASLRGASLNNPPLDGQRISVSLGSQDYTLAMAGGRLTVEGPESDRLVARFDANDQLVISAPGGTLDGRSMTISGAATDLTAFGLGTGSGYAMQLTGQPLDMGAVPQGDTVMNVSVGSQSYAVTVSRAADTITIGTEAGFPANATFDTDSGRLMFAVPDGQGQIHIGPQTAAATLGFVTSNSQMTVAGDQITFQSTDDTALDVQAHATSLAANRLTLSGLPDEELIVVLSGDTSALRLTGSMDLAPISQARLAEAFDLHVIDADLGLIEVRDADTGQSIATRTLSDTGIADALGMRINIDGIAARGDTFHIRTSQDTSGDNRNLEALLDLAEAQSGRDGFSDMFRTLISDAGAKVSAGYGRVEVATANENALSKAMSELSGVNLDEEAARLIELQQAYQASSRVLTTAQKMFDALLNL